VLLLRGDRERLAQQVRLPRVLSGLAKPAPAVLLAENVLM
jgi:hypothetical protein